MLACVLWKGTKNNPQSAFLDISFSEIKIGLG